VLLDHARHHGIRHLQVSTTRSMATSPRAQPRAPRTRRCALRARTPHSKSGGDMQGARLRADLRHRRADHPRRQYLRPAPVSEKFLPLFITNAFDGRAAAVYGDGRRAASGCTSKTIAPRSRWRCAAVSPARSTTSAAGAREHEVVRRILDLTGASPDLVRQSQTGPGTIAATGRLDEAAQSRLDAAAFLRRGRARGDRRVVPREP